MKNRLRFILGIETSCDETGVAIYELESGIRAHVLYSQIPLHQAYGGVIPELASRTQLEKIIPTITRACADAHLSIDDIDVIAVTNRPGLPGSLLVGVCVAKSIAWVKKKPII